MMNATREKTRLWLLTLVGVVATLLGQTHAREIFAPSPHESGVFAAQTQASTGENYDACQYDTLGSLLAANNAGRGPVIVGETMSRVTEAARGVPGAKILNDMPTFTGTADQVTSSMMQYNRTWILDQMRSGRQIIDIGTDATRQSPSIFYQMEQNMMQNYQKLHPGSLNITKP
jgi:hypothetical protein